MNILVFFASIIGIPATLFFLYHYAYAVESLGPTLLASYLVLMLLYKYAGNTEEKKNPKRKRYSRRPY